jgi:glutamate--cysteine ligase
MIAAELFGDGRVGYPDRVGVELELFPVYDVGRSTVVPLRSKEGGLLSYLDEVARRSGWRMAIDEFDNATLDTTSGGRITLEPAGQIEYSTPPFTTPGEALADLRSVVRVLEEEGVRRGVRFIASGYNGFSPEESISLQVMKPRYRIMDRHFERIGEFGRKMMRATCSLQINLDFGSQSVVAERWRLANMIAPSLNAIFANSPHSFRGRDYRSFRHEIWRHADPSRTGRLYDRPDLDPVADYLRFALDASVMMFHEPGGNLISPPRPMTFREWLGGQPGCGFPAPGDWRLHLSTLFPDVRPRGWMEIRSVDALPAQWWGVPVALATTLLYDDTLRREALDRLEGRERAVDAAEHEHGGSWRSDFETGRELLQIVLPCIDDPLLADDCREYFERFTGRGLTPASSSVHLQG